MRNLREVRMTSPIFCTRSECPLHMVVVGDGSVELLGGLAVIVGAFIPLASIPMTFVLLVAIFTVHLPYGFSSIKLQSVTAAGAHFGQPGYETDLLYLAGLAALVLGGSGPFALDQLVRRPRIRSTNRSHGNGSID